MTIGATSRVSYPGAGSAGPFTVPFRFITAADLAVIIRRVTGIDESLTYVDDYTVSGAGNATGSITLVTALAVGETIVIRRAPGMVQATSFRNQASFFGATHEDALDLLTMLIQSVDDKAGRAVRLPTSHLAAAEIIPTAGAVIGFNGAGDGFQAYTLDSAAIGVPAGGRTVATATAYLSNNAVFNVLDFGARGNNDAAYALTNRVAFQAAIDAAEAAGPGGLVRVPAGNYKISGTIQLKTCVTLLGDGMDATALRHAGGSAVPLLQASGTLLAPIPKISVQDMAVYGDGTSTYGLSLSYGAYAYYRNVRFYGFATAGVYVVDSWNMVFDRCQAEYCYDGFSLSRDANNVALRNCLAQFNTHVGYLLRGARQHVLHDCDSESNAVGVRIVGATGFNSEKITLQGLYSEANTVDHIQVYSESGGIIPRGITIRDVYFVRLLVGEDGIGIRITDVSTALIEGCLFSNDALGMTRNLVLDAGGSISGLVYGAGNRDESSAHESIGAGCTYSTQFASSSDVVGYRDGAGGAVVQATNKATAVTLNRPAGTITLNNAALADAAIVSFVFNNAALRTTDVVVLNHKSGGTIGGYLFWAVPDNGAGNGQGKIYVKNISGGSLSEAVVLQYAIIRGANA